MKKDILKILMGALLITFIALVGRRQYLSMKKKEYRQQLENTINNKYLEGEDVIGAYYYYNRQMHKDSATIYKTSDVFSIASLPLWDYPGMGTVSFWGGQNFDHTNTIIDMLKSGDYEWYDFNDCATTYGPFMIIVKKTNRGYDIIGEFILGIALTYSYPDYLIRETSFTFNWGKLLGGECTDYFYHIKTNMIDSYIKNLFEDKYNGITIRNEITRNNGGTERNVKYDMLDGLVMKGACPADSSLYFRVNKYFELKFDDYFTEIGSSPLVWHTGSYGNYTQTVFTNTVTMHYSIQENEGVLEEELKKKAIIYLFLLEFLYLLLTITIVRRKRKHNSSTL